MLEFPYKISDKNEILKNSRNYITRNYSSQAWTQAQSYFAALDNSRLQALKQSNPGPQLTMQYIEALSLYYRRLIPITSRIAADKIKFKVSWQDSVSSKKFQFQSYNFEQCCVLYNIGIAYSRLGNETGLNSEDGIKQALQYYEVSAGCFDKIRQMAAEFRGNQLVDLSSENLSMMINILIAQAYYCFYNKIDKNTPNKANLVKLANTIANYYSFAHELLVRDPLKKFYSRDYAEAIHSRELQFRAAAHYWQSFSEKEAGIDTGRGFGVAVCRLRIAQQLIQQAMSCRGVRGQSLETARQLQATIVQASQEAEDDNRRIYLDDVPNEAQLARLQEVSIINPKFPPPVDILSETSDAELLEALIPQPVLGMMTEYRGILQEMLTVENNRICDLNRQVQAQLSSMQLPHKLNALDQQEGVPENLWKRLSEIQGQGGFGQVQNLLNSLRLLKDNNQHILDELNAKLEREAEEDQSLRQTYGNMWSRTTSNAVNSYLKADLEKYRLKLNEAQILDSNSIALYESSQEILQLLTKPKAELDSMLPNQDTSQWAENQTVIRMNQKMEELYRVQKEIGDDFAQLTSAIDQDNVIGELMKAFNQQADKKEVFEREFIKFNPFKERIQQLSNNIRGCIEEIQKDNSAFDAELGSIQNDQARLTLLQQLNDAADRYKELINNLAQGHQFYTQLTRHLQVLQQKVNDFIYSRNLESQDMIERLTSQSQDSHVPNQYGNLMQGFNQGHPPSGNFNPPPSGNFNHPPSGNFNHPPSGNFNHPPSGNVNHPPSVNFNQGPPPPGNFNQNGNIPYMPPSQLNSSAQIDNQGFPYQGGANQQYNNQPHGQQGYSNQPYMPQQHYMQNPYQQYQPSAPGYNSNQRK